MRRPSAVKVGGVGSDLGEAVGQVEGGGGEGEGATQAGDLVEGGADQVRPVVGDGGPAGKQDFGVGEAEVGGDVPACERSWLPGEANAVEGKPRTVGGEPGDVEWPVGRAEMRWTSAPRTSLGIGCTARPCSGRACEGRDRGGTGASGVCWWDKSGPGEGVADRRREVVLLAVVGDERRAVPDDDLGPEVVGEREVGVDGEADRQVGVEGLSWRSRWPTVRSWGTGTSASGCGWRGRAGGEGSGTVEAKQLAKGLRPLAVAREVPLAAVVDVALAGVLYLPAPQEQTACVYERPGQSVWSGLPELVCLWSAGQSLPSSWWLVSGARKVTMTSRGAGAEAVGRRQRISGGARHPVNSRCHWRRSARRAARRRTLLVRRPYWPGR